MIPQISRRALFAVAPLAVTNCRKPEEAYFGKTNPPRGQRLVYLISAEPATLDPAKSADLWESYIVHSLFEGLTTLHPVTAEPMAGLATHVQVTSDGIRHTFFLRGQAEPRGRRLPDTGDLPREFCRGPTTRSGKEPARWSDGRPITAHDFVYSWRRALEPATAANLAYQLFCVEHAEEITAGKRSPGELSARALDDFVLQIDLRAPAPSFLQLISNRIFCPVPRQAIEASSSSWTEPGRMVSSGAFTLSERRPNEYIVLTRNRHYYEANIAALSELVFLTVIDGTANVNLYETGDAALIQTNIPSLMPTLSRKRDFRSYPSCGAVFQVINTTKPPLDDVRVRYALNMGTDKRAIAAFMGVGRTPARNLVPPIDGYDAPSSLPVTIDGVSCDVLAFNPQAARELLGKAIGTRPLRLEMLGPNLPEAKLLAQVFKHQWRETLGVELTLVTEELQTWIQSVFNKSYRGIAGWADYAGHLDPIWFLDAYRSESSAKWTGWTDPKYDAMVVEAGATKDRAERLRKLSECERYLLRAMPLVPLYADVWVYMRKPFVRGLGANPLDRQQFKYAWIDTNWRPT